MNPGIEFSASGGGPPEQPMPPHRLQPWYQAYIAALFESDKTRIQDRIQQAKRLVVLRERELLTHSADTPETRSLNNALNALIALSNYLDL